MTDQPMSQWPSEWEYVLPVRPVRDEILGTEPVAAKTPDGESRTVERQGRNDRVDA